MFDYPQRHQTHSSELPSDSALNACWKMNLNQVKPKIQAHGSKRIVILCDGKIPKPLMDRSSSLELTPSLNNSSSHTLSLHPILCSVKRHLERSLWRRWYGSDHQRREIMSVIYLPNSHLFIFLPLSFSRISLTVELLSHLSYRFWCSCFYLFITYISTSPGASPLSSSYLIPRYLSDALYHPGYLLSKWSRYLWRLECGSRLVGLRWDHILISVHEGLSLWSQDFWFLSLRCVCVFWYHS